MTDTDFSDTYQFFVPPHPSGRVMGIAQQHHLHFRISGLTLQVFVLNRVSIVGKAQRG